MEAFMFAGLLGAPFGAILGALIDRFLKDKEKLP
jgi:hypothetical protein